MFVQARSVWEEGEWKNLPLKRDCRFFAGMATKRRPDSDISIVSIIVQGHGTYTLSACKKYDGGCRFNFLCSLGDSGVVTIGSGSHVTFQYNGLTFFLNDRGRFFIKEN